MAASPPQHTIEPRLPSEASPSLHDYFLNDFRDRAMCWGPFKLVGKVGLPDKPRQFELECFRYLDYEARTEYFGIYLGTDVGNAVEVCRSIATTFSKLRDTMRAIPHLIKIDTPDIEPANPTTFAFTGNVFIYHESLLLSLEDLGLLTAHYKSKGLSATFRGPGYAAARGRGLEGIKGSQWGPDNAPKPGGPESDRANLDKD